MIADDCKSNEARRDAIQISLDGQRSRAERNRSQFATPNVLASEIAKFVVKLA